MDFDSARGQECRRGIVMQRAIRLDIDDGRGRGGMEGALSNRADGREAGEASSVRETSPRDAEGRVDKADAQSEGEGPTVLYSLEHTLRTRSRLQAHLEASTAELHTRMPHRRPRSGPAATPARLPIVPPLPPWSVLRFLLVAHRWPHFGDHGQQHPRSRLPGHCSASYDLIGYLHPASAHSFRRPHGSQ